MAYNREWLTILPRIRGFRLEEYDCYLGIVNEGKRIEHTLKVKNVGNQDLHISQLSTSCGCLSVNAINDVIAPGHSSDINLIFDTTNLKGMQSRELYIESNDPISPSVQVNVGCTVKAWNLVLSAPSVQFGDVKQHSSVVEGITATDPGDASLVINKVVSSSAFVGASVTKSSQDGPQKYEIALSLSPNTPVGTFKSTVVLYTNQPRNSLVEVPVTATVKGNIEAWPYMLFVGQVANGTIAKASTILRTDDGKPFTVKRVKSPTKFAKVKVEPKGPSDQYVISITLKGSTPVGNMQGDVVVSTSDKDQPEIRIPLYAYVEN